MYRQNSLYWLVASLAICSLLVATNPSEPSHPNISVESSGEGSWLGSLPGKIARSLLNSEQLHVPNRVELEDSVPNHARSDGDRSRGFTTGPFLSDSNISGFVVKPRNPSHQMYKLGLKNGDAVRRINNIRIDGPVALDKIYDILRTSSEVELEVERDGRLIVVNAKTSERDKAEYSVTSSRELVDRLHPPSYFAGKGFRMKPLLQGGDIVGMRLKVEDVSHPLYRLGLRTNDVVLGVNGTATNGPESLSNIYREIRKNSKMEFKIERDGKAQTLVAELE